jgi:hypothetical protein
MHVYSNLEPNSERKVFGIQIIEKNETCHTRWTFSVCCTFLEISERDGIFRTHTKIAGSVVADVIK